MHDQILKRAASLLRPVPDFPKPGILFFDLNPLLRDMMVMDHIATVITDYWRPLEVDVVAGFDSRGFLFGPMVAERLGVPFTMIRKKGKLPPPTKAVSYGLEYGTDVIEMADDGFLVGKRVLLIDDLLATGGTAAAGVELVNLLGGITVGFTCVSEIPALCGRSKLLNTPVHSLITIMDGQALVGVEYCVDVLLTDAAANAVILIERQTDPCGWAMPGGRIDPGESALTAVVREAKEETGTDINTPTFLKILCQPGRDPRGEKVSLVFTATTTTHRLQGEPGKTRVYRVLYPTKLPRPDAFVLGHGEVVEEHWVPEARERERRDAGLELTRTF